MGYRKWYDSPQLLNMLYYEKGMTINEVAEYIKVTPETVRQLFIKHKIKESK